MSFIKAIIDFFKSLFVKKEEEKKSVVESTTETIPSMHEDVFAHMVAGEKEESVIESIKAEMKEKNALGVFPYTISTDNWTYTINRAIDKYGHDYTDHYGLQYSATQIHK